MAMRDEINVLEENKTYKVTNLSNGKKFIRHKWAFKVKFNADGTIEK